MPNNSALTVSPHDAMTVTAWREGQAVGPTNPQRLNRYSYVDNNPLRYTDPSGHALTLTYDEAQQELKALKAMRDGHQQRAESADMVWDILLLTIGAAFGGLKSESYIIPLAGAGETAAQGHIGSPHDVLSVELMDWMITQLDDFTDWAGDYRYPERIDETITFWFVQTSRSRDTWVEQAFDRPYDFALHAQYGTGTSRVHRRKAIAPAMYFGHCKKMIGCVDNTGPRGNKRR
ncbi:MAG: hypothetical protein GFH24_608350n112 [Chloroflexi bacterium AL-N5]|nr:hypothetical protein [Chloroflexi bacterium AL-N5]